jgi:hypothetical protein
MTISPHVLAGAAVAVAVTDNWILAFCIGVILHFLLDGLPHLDPGTFFEKKEKEEPWPVWIYYFSFMEFVLLAFLVYILYYNDPRFVIILSGGLGGMFVDVLDNNPVRAKLHKYPFFKQLNLLHEGVHYELPKNKWYWGLLIELIIIGGSIWYISWLK